MMNHNRGRLDIKYYVVSLNHEDWRCSRDKRKQDDLSPYPMTWASSEVLETIAGQDDYDPSLQIVSHCRGNKDTPQKAGAKQQNMTPFDCVPFVCWHIFLQPQMLNLPLGILFYLYFLTFGIYI